MIQRNEILTTDEALAMICRSKSWFYAHCNDSDFPRRIYWDNGRQKYFKRDEWLEFCEQHNIEIVRNV